MYSSLVCVSNVERPTHLTSRCIFSEHISGNVQIANRRWSGTSTQSASADITNKAVRPHTAHGARTADIGGEGFSSQGAVGDDGEAAPVVAGARGMMRYGKDLPLGLRNASITFCDYLVPRAKRSVAVFFIAKQLIFS